MAALLQAHIPIIQSLSIVSLKLLFSLSSLPPFLPLIVVSLPFYVYSPNTALPPISNISLPPISKYLPSSLSNVSIFLIEIYEPYSLLLRYVQLRKANFLLFFLSHLPPSQCPIHG